MKIINKSLFIYFILFVNISSLLSDEQKNQLTEADCQQTEEDYFVNFLDQGNIPLLETSSGIIYQYEFVLGIKHLIIKQESNHKFKYALNEIQNLNNFQSEVDIQSSLPKRCKYVDKQDQLEIFVVTQQVTETLNIQKIQQYSFEQKLILTAKMSLSLFKLQSNGYLHGNVQFSSFQKLNNYSLQLGNLKYLRKKSKLSSYSKKNKYLENNLKQKDQQQLQDDRYDIKSEIYSFGMMIFDIFFQKLDSFQNTDYLQQNTVLIDIPQDEQQKYLFFVQSVQAMIISNKQFRKDSLEDFFKAFLKLIRVYYQQGNANTNLNSLFVQEMIYINSITDQSLRYRLNLYFQNVRQLLIQSSLNLTTKDLLKNMLVLKPKIEQDIQQNLQIQQRNFSTVDGMNNQDRFSLFQNRESYFANQFQVDQLNPHAQRAAYDQQAYIREQQEALKKSLKKDDKRQGGCCGFFI